MSIFEKAFKKFGNDADDLQALPGEGGTVEIEARLEETPDVAGQDKAMGRSPRRVSRVLRLPRMEKRLHWI